jgi:cbb3-type cytochrome oxidase maturation protein
VAAMNIVLILAPASVFLALIGLAAFWWTLRDGQYDDPLGDASRILVDDGTDRPASGEL